MKKPTNEPLQSNLSGAPSHEPSNPRARDSKPKLTPKQRRLITEIEDIAASVQMDYLLEFGCYLS